MYEVSIWVPIVLAEICILSSGTLGFLVWRGRRIQRRLRSEVEELRLTRQEPVEVVPPSEEPSVTSASEAAHALETAGQESEDDQSQSSTPQQTIEVMQEMIKQLQEKNLLLLQQMEVLEMHQVVAQEDKEKISSLQSVLREVEAELHILQEVNSRLKGSLIEEKRRLRIGEDELTVSAQRQSLLQGTIKELRMTNARLLSDLEVKNRRLEELEKKMVKYQQVKAENTKLQEQITKLSNAAEKEKELEALKQELWHVKTRLAQRESDLHHLQEEYDTLQSEYQRLFEHFQA
jgi:predicted  nucleic acid-binding Zn-ribbon protein